MNCWEHKKCGRERGGVNAAELGVCPAYEEQAGRACWLVAGTFCGGEVQGTAAQKNRNCMFCDFYKSFSLEERTAARNRFQVAV